MAKIAIVGNGPSRRLFSGYFDGPVMLCNTPQLDCLYDGIVVLDDKCFMWYRSTEYKPDRPIYTTPALETKFKEIGIDTVYGVFETKLMNVAQTAALHFSDTFNEVWLYGCDALWTADTSSFCDRDIPRAPRNSNLPGRWRERWKQVWDKKTTQFMIVQPFNGETPEYGKNVHFVQQSMPANKEIPTRSFK